MKPMKPDASLKRVAADFGDRWQYREEDNYGCPNCGHFCFTHYFPWAQSQNSKWCCATGCLCDWDSEDIYWYWKIMKEVTMVGEPITMIDLFCTPRVLMLKEKK